MCTILTDGMVLSTIYDTIEYILLVSSPFGIVSMYCILFFLLPTSSNCDVYIFFGLCFRFLKHSSICAYIFLIQILRICRPSTRALGNKRDPWIQRNYKIVHSVIQYSEPENSVMKLKKESYISYRIEDYTKAVQSRKQFTATLLVHRIHPRKHVPGHVP